MELDRLLLVKTRFDRPTELELDWSLLFVPSGESLQALARSLTRLARSHVTRAVSNGSRPAQPEPP